MRKLIYSMAVSLDGYINDANGNFGWSRPDQELHRFHNQLAREVDVWLYGRRLYETMRYWETADEREELGDAEREWAEVWKPTPKLVFSRTLDAVSEPNTTLLRGDAVEEVARLKAEPGKQLGVGGAGLAATLIRAGLVDEYALFVNPVAVGGGTPFWPPLEEQIDLELVETRTFASRVVYVRYAAAGG